MLKMDKCRIIWLFFVVTLLVDSYADETIALIGDELDGPNVCKRVDIYNVTVVITESVPYQEKEQAWCWSVPPRCPKYKIRFRQQNKTEVLTKTRGIKECCEGYTKNERGDRCVPHCKKPCQHGTCAAPATCKCDSGYGGPACDISEYKYNLLLEFLV